MAPSRFCMDSILQTLTTIFTQPSLYTDIVAIILAFYLVWALAKQQYLGTNQQFDVLAISLASGVVGIFIVQTLYPGYLLWPDSWQLVKSAWTSPFTLAALAGGYALAGLTSWWYIKHIRYPYWRVMDSNVLGVMVVGLGQILGILLTKLTIPLAGLTVGWAILLLILLVLYQKTKRPGVTTGAHLVMVFGFCLVAQYLLVPWQGIGTGVEYGLGSIGILLGIGIMVRQWRAAKPQPTSFQLPAGVSQRFRDTFSRALQQQPSKPDGSSHS